MLLGENAGEEEGVEGFGGAGDAEVVEFAEGAEGVVEHAGLAIEDDGVGEEAVVAEVGAGLEVVEEGGDGGEGLGAGELGDGDGEGHAVEVGLGGE